MLLEHSHKRLNASTRASGEAALRAFATRMGKRYTNGRNYDRGEGKHRDVSMLSPYLRRRLVLEQDAISTAVLEHGAEGAEKFIQEVFWRAYFKGWMERRPVVWDQYREGLVRDLAVLDRDRGLRRRVEAAVSGQSGLNYFDSWADELVETGYLHNHARMWFASIWIFTLELPWRLGADFSSHISSTAMQHQIRWDGAGWPACTHAVNLITPKAGISRSSPTTVLIRDQESLLKSSKVLKMKNLMAYQA